MTKIFRNATVVVAINALIMAPASAGFMDDFYTSAGAAVNVTPAQYRQTGSGGFVTGGSVVWRVPQRTFTPFLWQPPSIKAGCGGIDMYLGSFGFANTSQFVDYLRQVGQSALGLFFKMALKAMSPDLEGAINDLTAEINKYNNMAKSSCEAASSLLTGAGLNQNVMDAAWKTAKQYAMEDGTSADQATLSQMFDSNLTAIKTKVDGKATNSGGKVEKAVARNYLWSAMNSGDMTDFPVSLKQVAMSLIGVEGNAVNASSPDALDPIVLPHTVAMVDLVGRWDLSTVPLSLIKCPATDTEQCLRPAPSAENHKPFARIAYERLKSLRDKIQTRAALTAADEDGIKMLGMTTLPVWKVLELTSSPARQWLSEDYIRKFSNVIGYELAIAFVTAFTQDVQKTLAKTKPTEDNARVVAALQQLKLRLDRLQDEAVDVKRQIDMNSGGIAGTIQELQHLERTLYQNMSTRMLDNLKYAQR